MERADIAALGDASLAYVRAHPPQDPAHTLVRMTSGTTGKEPIVLMSTIDPESIDDVDAAAGTLSTVSCLGSRGIRLANVLAERGAGEVVTRKLPLDAADLAPSSARLIGQFAPNRLYGLSSFIAKFGSAIDEQTAGGIARIRFSGESVHDTISHYLAERFPHAEAYEYYFANDVGGFIGRRSCRALAPGQFHLGSQVTVEIDAPDAEGYGDILVSRTIYGPVKAEHYRVGDIGRLIEIPCACGEALTLELRGRRGVDYVKVGGLLLRREEFDRVLQPLNELFDSYRVDVWQAFDEAALRTHVTVRLYRRGSAGTPALEAELAERIARSLYVTQQHTYAEMVGAGSCAPLTVRFQSDPFEGGKDVRIRLLEH